MAFGEIISDRFVVLPQSKEGFHRNDTLKVLKRRIRPKDRFPVLSLDIPVEGDRGHVANVMCWLGVKKSRSRLEGS